MGVLLLASPGRHHRPECLARSAPPQSRPAIQGAVRSFPKCGILDFGFARIRCPECGDEFLLAHSCKSRCLCPSCQKKRQVEFGEWVATELMEAVPHRHVVLSVPRRLRPFFRRNCERLPKLARAAWWSVGDRTPARPGGVERLPERRPGRRPGAAAHPAQLPEVPRAARAVAGAGGAVLLRAAGGGILQGQGMRRVRGNRVRRPARRLRAPDARPRRRRDDRGRRAGR
ncbi:MAG: transposase zinc-binding domain-containing protein [Planctomycetia bacterium]|nr:transposase zinc-binding domain-containing protein [Planctomycetia bacterium]